MVRALLNAAGLRGTYYLAAGDRRQAAFAIPFGLRQRL